MDRVYLQKSKSEVAAGYHIPRPRLNVVSNTAIGALSKEGSELKGNIKIDAPYRIPRPRLRFPHGGIYVSDTDIGALCKEATDLSLQNNRRGLPSGKDYYECGCCYEDTVVLEDIGMCGNGHRFCRTCITRYCEDGIGNGRSTFPCLGADCDAIFPEIQLQIMLPSPLREGILKIVQAEEIRQANITDLVTCPHCSYAVIMPNQHEPTVLQCLNPDCHKVTCRFCRDSDHRPRDCKQVETEFAQEKRTYFENKMAYAMIRICYKCGKRFYIEDGCNFVTCQCGAKICYICRQPIIDHNHFHNGRCLQNSDVNALHEREIREAQIAAQKRYGDLPVPLHSDSSPGQYDGHSAAHIDTYLVGGPPETRRRQCHKCKRPFYTGHGC